MFTSSHHLKFCIFFNILGIVFLLLGKYEAGFACLICGLCKLENYEILKQIEREDETNQ